MGVRVPPGVRLEMLPQDAAILAPAIPPDALKPRRFPWGRCVGCLVGQAEVAQLAEAPSSKGGSCRFESCARYVEEEKKTQNDLTRQIVENMRLLRKERKMSALELSEAMERMGIPFSRNTIANLEVDRRNEVTVTELMGLAKLFDVGVEWFITTHGPKCNWCMDFPPEGYQCMTCLLENSREPREEAHATEACGTTETTVEAGQALQGTTSATE